ncbi:bifunctional methylenetetrahydrofolate dehydrogenase/methenyltetrahydrofolate cyclohydrolase FolD [Candidatus Margulisiibacteriota bacterium]
MGNIIDGKARAIEVQEKLRGEVEALKKKGINPRLDVVLVGEDPASQVYVRNKEKACAAAGIESQVHRLPADTKEEKLIDLVKKLNKDKKVHGILVQLPLPKHISPEKVLNTIDANKDVDGLNVQNMGMLIKGEGDPFVPCTPQGIMDLIGTTGIELKGKNAVVIGRSNIVGKPMALLLLKAHATVTICHSRTTDLPSVAKNADVLVAAIGRAKMVKKDWIKPGAVVIDVGMNRDQGKLCGDVDFESAKEVAGFITPVPGGVGPMTIAMLLKNTLKAASNILV